MPKIAIGLFQHIMWASLFCIQWVKGDCKPVSFSLKLENSHYSLENLQSDSINNIVNSHRRSLPCIGLGGSVEWASDWWSGGRGHRIRQHSFVEIDHEIFAKVILSLSLFLERQLSVSGDRMCTNTG